MAAGKNAGIRGLAQLLRCLLEEHRRLEVAGLGEFHASDAGLIGFGGARRPAVFVSYVSEDRRQAEAIASSLDQAGFSAWLDKRRLRPGDSWLKTIEDAIDSSDFFIACLSRRSLTKRGAFQRELRMAIDCARNVPLEGTYFIPVRLDDCRVPRIIQRQWQYIDLFPDLNAGMIRVIHSLSRQWRKSEQAGPCSISDTAIPKRTGRRARKDHN